MRNIVLLFISLFLVVNSFIHPTEDKRFKLLHNIPEINFTIESNPQKTTICSFPFLKIYSAPGFQNPFNPVTTIKFTIPSNVKRQTSIVKLNIFDMLGREVTTLINEEKQPGTYEVQFDATGLSSGIYFYRLTTDSFIETKKMMVVK